MMAAHMIGYRRSKHVQSIIKAFRNIEKNKISMKSVIDARDYLLSDVTIMNRLRASNIIELRLSDVENAGKNPDYPGQRIIQNIKYKTSSVYGEKLIALPGALFEQLQVYVERYRP